MKPKDMPPPPPPPEREPKRKLSLKAAMAVATKAEGHQVFKPLMNPMDEFPSASSGAQQDMEAHLLELQADIINREELLNDGEKQLNARELELNEREALLKARKQIIESSTGGPNGAAISTEEKEALKALKKTLDAQEASLRGARDMLHTREAYIEECENALVEQSMILTEREARVEQREEDFDHRTKLRSEPSEAPAAN
jgi:chromosome segregation ATPase